jgi:hypothetical protein
VSNRAKEKGDRFEIAVRDFLRENGWPECERRAKQHAADRGDLILGPAWFTLDCKDHASIDLAGYMDQAAQEAVNARRPWFASIVKRRRKPVSEAYVVMPLRVFVEVAEMAEPIS